MGGFLNSIATSLELGRVRKMNTSAKGIGRAGRMRSGELLACEGNAVVACRDEQVLADAVVGGCVEYASGGWPVVVLHEGNDTLLATLRDACVAHGQRLVEVDGQGGFYDPLIGLSADDAASLLFRAAGGVRTVPDDMLAYLRVLTRVLEARGYATYVRMVNGCPHARIHEVIARAEAAGAITAAEAASMRSDVDASTAGRAAAQRFLVDVVREGVVLPTVAEVDRAVSLASYVRMGASDVLSIDLGQSAGESVVSLVLTEAEDLLRRGFGLQLVLACDTVGARVGERLAAAPSSLGWTVATRDIARAFAKPDELSRVAAACGRIAVFSQGLPASEMASALFGDYDKQDATVTTGGYGFGSAFGRGSVSVATRRERVVQPEEIRGLRGGEFYLLDATSGLFKGRVG